jgi:hypothetical protein
VCCAPWFFILFDFRKSTGHSCADEVISARTHNSFGLILGIVFFTSSTNTFTVPIKIEKPHAAEQKARICRYKVVLLFGLLHLNTKLNALIKPSTRFLNVGSAVH